MTVDILKPGHWPRFGQVLCGTMNERERLGLPEHWVASRWADEFPQYYDAVRRLDQAELMGLVENPKALLPVRIAAGQILALIGDPRIDTFHPSMISIAGGTVKIGLEPEKVDQVLIDFDGLGLDRKWIDKECPRHAIALKPFAIGRYPVTNQEYRDFLKDTRLDLIPKNWDYRSFPAAQSNHPVYTVTAEMADAYCAWLSEKTGQRYRLPTESEWEFAAAGPEGLEFPWGNDFRFDHANTAEVGLFASTPIGVFVEGASPFGVLDMAGNVEEYVADAYQAYPGGVLVSDHLTEIHGTYRVARGGTFARFRDLARTRRRHGYNPNASVYAMGFRLACDLQ